MVNGKTLVRLKLGCILTLLWGLGSLGIISLKAQVLTTTVNGATQMGWYNNGDCLIWFGEANWSYIRISKSANWPWGNFSGCNTTPCSYPFTISSEQFVGVMSMDSTTETATYEVYVNGTDCGAITVGANQRVAAPYVPPGCSPINPPPPAPLASSPMAEEESDLASPPDEPDCLDTNSTEIQTFQQLTGNPAIPQGFSKYATTVFDTPSGTAQIHFYMNPTTSEIYYGLDYKTIFQQFIGK